MKKVFYFSLGFLFLVLIFLVAYNFVFKNNVNDPSVNSSEKKITKEEKVLETKPVSVNISLSVNEDIADAGVSSDGFLYYYSFDDQALKRATLEGKDKTILL